MTTLRTLLAAIALLVPPSGIATAQQAPPQPSHEDLVVLHAAHLLDVANARLVSPGEVLIRGEKIVQAGQHVSRQADTRVLDLGQTTLMPGLIDAHTHLFLHPGNEAFQTVEETVPQRTLVAAAQARADLLAGFTAERDMGTEGAGCADVAVRNAIDGGLIPGPRMRVSCNAIDITGGHEDTSGLNPEEHLLSNADRANSADDLVSVLREQHKQGADFTKIYQTGPDRENNGELVTPFQYTEAQLATAVAEAARTSSGVAVHCTGEPGALFAAQAGVRSIDHADQLSPETMRLMHDKRIYAVPTFQISEYFAQHAPTPAAAERYRRLNALHAEEFKKQLAAGVPFAVGSDVGPFPHGTQAHEYELMVQHGMTPAQTLVAGLLNGARLLGWEDAIGQLLPGFFADIIAVPGNPLSDIGVLTRPVFVMKGGHVYRGD